MHYSFSRLAALDIRWADQFHAADASFRWNHANPHYQLIVASDGPVWIEAEGRRYTLRTGESLLLLPWESHTGWNHAEQQGSFFWAQFACEPALRPFDADAAPDLTIIHADRSELRTAGDRHEDRIVVPKLHLSSRRYRLLQLFEQLVEQSRAAQGYFRFRQTLLLGEILGLIAADVLEQSERDTSLPQSYFTYRRLVNLLNNGFARPIGKALLERELDRKYAYLCQVFKKYADLTIVQYVQRLRVQRACHLLTSTGKSVGDIAAEVGFEDAFYFSRVFKRLEGVSPARYRDAKTTQSGKSR
ncbi:AraC family transcriptional regulator [Paenibacillus sp. IB182496]|uniref:AraC family transcriptional regulator n=1 Tax=Paenibacillus sabuli TaxID=2772509 RepID=A0A927GTY4_9BACL|nr:AraC family transcriptional regulator [Paenibacillus sabuli]MBD2847575.1 AraC family transcriptional regulator [Paenibacillus sabuli]